MAEYKEIDNYKGFDLIHKRDHSYKTWASFYVVYKDGYQYSNMVFTSIDSFRRIIDNYLTKKEKV